MTGTIKTTKVTVAVAVIGNLVKRGMRSATVFSTPHWELFGATTISSGKFSYGNGDMHGDAYGNYVAINWVNATRYSEYTDNWVFGTPEYKIDTDLYNI